MDYLRRNGYPDARRQLAGDGLQSSDIDGVPGISIEVKDRADSAWPTWRRQALTAASPLDSVVVVRRTRGNPDVGAWIAHVAVDYRREWRVTTFGDIFPEVQP